MRIIGLDLGTVTCGMSISDPLGMLARELTTIQFSADYTLEMVAKAIVEICKTENVETVVLGLPKHLNNQIGESAKRVLAFEKCLKRLGMTVHLVDERFSTKMAISQLQSSGVKLKKGKRRLDQMAAVNILQIYLDQQRGGISNHSY